MYLTETRLRETNNEFAGVDKRRNRCREITFFSFKIVFRV